MCDASRCAAQRVARGGRTTDRAAAGRLDFAVLGTLTVLAVHLALRPAARLLDRAPAAGSDPEAAVRPSVHVECERRAETQIRALLQALTNCGLAPTGLRAGREREDTVSLCATVAVNGEATGALEQVISRLSLEPAVRDPALAPGARGGAHRAAAPAARSRPSAGTSVAPSEAR